MKPFRYFFFRNYQLNLRQRAAIPWLRPLALTSLFLSLNVVALAVVAFELLSIDGVANLSKAELQSIVILWIFIVFVVFYQRWIRTGRYATFDDEFRRESTAQRSVRTVYLFAYGIASLLAPGIAGYWTFLRNVASP